LKAGAVGVDFIHWTDGVRFFKKICRIKIVAGRLIMEKYGRVTLDIRHMLIIYPDGRRIVG
jgi:hypothetical protein